MTTTGGASGRDDRNRPTSARRPMPPSVPPRPRPAAPAAPARKSVIPGGSAAPRQPGSIPPSSPQRSGQQRPPTPQPSERPPATPPPASAPPKKRRKRHGWCIALGIILAVLLGGLIVFLFWIQSNLQTVPALSGAPNTPGQTYLIVGSDSRDGYKQDGTTGARTDTIMILHRPEEGPTALISIPRDSYVEIPGHGKNKINAAYVFGGPELLVETVEILSGLTIDGYMEVGFTGVADMVDAIGGVELCYDYDVSDVKSHLEWEAGCHVADGETALAFSRMRYSDPLGDIGRAERQRQVVGAVATEVLNPSTLLNPFEVVPVADAALDAFTFNDGTGIVDLARMALALNSGLNDVAVTGTPPIASLGYSVEGVGSTVLLDPDEVDQFWDDVATGALEPGESVGGV